MLYRDGFIIITLEDDTVPASFSYSFTRIDGPDILGEPTFKE